MRRATGAYAGALVVLAGLTIASSPWALALPALSFACKPAATAVLIAFAATRGVGQPARRWVITGLSLSLAGDVALLWPREGFLPGLVSFLLAHLAYLAAFTRERRLAAWWPAFALYAVVAAGILAVLWPGVPAPLRAPVPAYVACLASMAAQAAVLARTGAPRGRIVALGGALFMLSDALLAWNRFATPLPMADLWILATYWAAQWCIASWLAPREESPRQGEPSPRAA